MVHKADRPTAHDMRAMKARGEKISMLYVTTLDEAAAADAAGIHMLSIESRFFSPEMREAAGRCFVQVGLPFGPYGQLATAEDYLRAARSSTLPWAATASIAQRPWTSRSRFCDNHMPVVAHVGLIPSYITWTGWRAVGKTAHEARAVWDHVKQLEAIGCFGAELEVVPDRLGAFISANTPMIMLGMGAGPGADAQYLFAEDVLGCTDGHRPRHAKTYRNFAAEYARLQAERIAAFKEFIADVNTGGYPQHQHNVAMADAEFEIFKAGLGQ